jgi:hypothetical protein
MLSKFILNDFYENKKNKLSLYEYKYRPFYINLNVFDIGEIKYDFNTFNDSGIQPIELTTDYVNETAKSSCKKSSSEKIEYLKLPLKNYKVMTKTSNVHINLREMNFNEEKIDLLKWFVENKINLNDIENEIKRLEVKPEIKPEIKQEYKTRPSFSKKLNAI